jgi:hypothetical protein
MSGQLALVIGEETVVAAAVWEALPAERRLEVTLRLAGCSRGWSHRRDADAAR